MPSERRWLVIDDASASATVMLKSVESEITET